MDETVYEKSLQSTAYSNNTRVKYYDSRQANKADEWINDETLYSKLPYIAALIGPKSPVASKTPEQDDAPFILITTTGDAGSVSGSDKLGICSNTFQYLMETCGFPRQLAPVYLLRQPHLSRHIHYDETNMNPVALSIIVRAPRNSQVVVCAIRLRLQDRACVCLLSSRVESRIEDLRSRCLHREGLLHRYPPYITTVLFEKLMEENIQWLYDAWRKVEELETTTGMLPRGWESHRITEKQNVISDKFLRLLHEANVELLLAKSVLTFAGQLGTFCLKTLDLVEDLREGLGLPPLREGDRVMMEDQNKHTQELYQHCSEKFAELLSRVQSQINVTFSLIARADSLVNLSVADDSRRIALAAARDSQTMKTITVITLTFLPLTLVTTVWSANIFTLDAKINWRIYLITSLCFSIIVFATWLVYQSTLERKTVLHTMNQKEVIS